MEVIALVDSDGPVHYPRRLAECPDKVRLRLSTCAPPPTLLSCMQQLQLQGMALIVSLLTWEDILKIANQLGHNLVFMKTP
jgi:hypothetical protein